MGVGLSLSHRMLGNADQSFEDTPVAVGNP